eukprot:353241-Chlamydomonas_euryale.AAC.2
MCRDAASLCLLCSSWASQAADMHEGGGWCGSVGVASLRLLCSNPVTMPAKMHEVRACVFVAG